MRSTINKAIESSWIIVKLVIPIYILADILYYYGVLSKVAFLVEPFTSLLGLPAESAPAIISGMFLNLYAAVAFAAPLDMTAQQWSVLAIFLGVCHSLVVENAIMKRIGISSRYAYALRFFGGLLIAYSATWLPENWFDSVKSASNAIEGEHYQTFMEMLLHSLENAIVLTLKIVVLISVLIAVMDGFKRLPFIQNSKQNISKGFSILIGLFLGITYGAGIIVAESRQMRHEDLFWVGTFLMIAHAVVEDTLLFVLFGADFAIVVTIRIIWAVLFAYVLTLVWGKTFDDDIK